jgi:alkaline phosphatase D
VGSCSYVNEPEFDRPGTPYGADYQIFTSIHQKRPDAMLWLGDNTYLREVDWFTRTGFLHRYTHTRSLQELQPLLASTHHYAIWDDHDYGPNDSDGSFVHKDMATEIFKLFWANPSFGLPGQGGITGYFQWADVDFFLLDNRYFRTPNKRKTGDRVLLGKVQLEWLIDALAASNAPFKMVAIGGQVLTTYAGHETYVNLCPEERTYLLRRIDEEGIKNVIFLTGDRHHSEFSKLVTKNGITIYDWTVSPLTSGVHQTDEKNLLREEGSLFMQRNFGMLEFSGPRTQRSLTMRIFDVSGKELWTRTVQSEK